MGTQTHNKHTTNTKTVPAVVKVKDHTPPSFQKHTSTHSTPEEGGPALQGHPAHAWRTHVFGGLVNVPLMGEKTRDTGGDTGQKQDNRKPKKSTSVFFSLTFE